MDIDVEKGQVTSTINDQETNDWQNEALEDVIVQTPNIAVISGNRKKKHRRKVQRENPDINSDPSPTFDGSIEHLNEEVLNHQRPSTMVVDNIDDTNVKPMKKNQRMLDSLIMDHIQLYTKTTNNTKTDLGPVIGYAEEPLLPLAEACAPLTDILHDLSSYVQMALDETPPEPPDGLTIDESAAIRLYTIEWTAPHRSLYSMLNYILKKADREELRPYHRYMKLFLTAVVKLPCVPPLTVWRGVTKNLSTEFPPGTPVTWWAFSSCTTALTVLENNMYLGNAGSRTLFSVEAINGRTVRAHSHFVTEDEILLLPGTYMIVQSQFSPAPEMHIIHLKQVVPEEVLLQPPFEGHLYIFNHLF
jgi:hypothetical protein